MMGVVELLTKKIEAKEEHQVKKVVEVAEPAASPKHFPNVIVTIKSVR